jgi:valyl-tRNA synthetase
MEMEPRYDPTKYEDAIYKRWEESGYFKAPLPGKNAKYSIVIPPPNITGALHMGHALNNTIQDILIRYYRQQGLDTLWLPGTDHAGIATQHVVEKELSKEGATRRDIGRKNFVDRVWKWKDEYGNRIIEQLKRLGTSCDWPLKRFTLDDGLSRAVRHVFVKLFEKGLIYRGNYLVNWCPGCRTALSDDEVAHKESHGKMWDLKYPLKDGSGFITVSTTRPETMLGDTAVAVHPEDPRYKDVIGKTLILPLMNREIYVIADPVVDISFGTGAVKVTPAHDPADFDLGRRHDLKFITVIGEDGSINENGGAYKGLDRYAARKKVLEDLDALGLLGMEKPHDHAVGQCYRCHSAVEPYLSNQWFVKMRPLAEPAIKEVREGRITFHPKRYENIYFDWLENVRDWCISRQLWWGHRIPVFYCENGHMFASEEDAPLACRECGSPNLRQDEDVLDTWFSSALWPFSTMGFPDETPLLEKYYPTDVLVTDRGIIFFWVARMVMMGLEFMRERPFNDVYIHGTILDEQGRKMSKSLGNGIDPIEMIGQYGADAVRFSLIMLSSEGQDLRLSPTRFEMGRNFANKVWNAARFVLTNMGGFDPAAAKAAEPAPEDRWILTALAETIEDVQKETSRYHFNAAVTAIYNFTWSSFCDWYLEIIKPRLLGEDAPAREKARETASFVIDNILRLLHPYMPFLAEELWQRLRGVAGTSAAAEEAPTIMYAAPAAGKTISRDMGVYRTFEILTSLVQRVRHIRGEYKIPPRRELEAVIFSSGFKTELAVVEEHGDFIRKMAFVKEVRTGNIERPRHSAITVHEKIQIFVPLEGIVDLEAEKARLKKEIEKTGAKLLSVSKKLKNQSFLERAPAEVVEQERSLQTNLAESLNRLEENLRAIE